MRSLTVTLMTIPFLAMLFTYRFDNRVKSIIATHHESNQTYLIDSSSVTMGPHLEEDTLDARYFSLATSSPDSFISFKEALAFKESQGKYWRVNSLGYLGKYQFGTSTLDLLGVKDTTRFLSSPRLQERAFVKNVQYNYEVLAPYIEKYEGKTIAGVPITASGVIAAAHLSGPGGVKRFFKTNGRKASRDAYGSSIISYMKRFAGYDISDVIAY